jgi:type I restriction enzyme M protein
MSVRTHRPQPCWHHPPGRPRPSGVNNHAAFIWSVADLLRGDYKQSEYGKVILPLTVIRRLDCVLAPTKAKVLERHAQLAGQARQRRPGADERSGEQFYNTSKLDLPKLLDDPSNIADNLRATSPGSPRPPAR